MPRENSFSDEGRSLTPDLDEIDEGPNSPVSMLPNVQTPTYPPHINQPISVDPRSPSKRSVLSKIKSKSPTSQKNRPWPGNGKIHTPIERFRAVVRKVMALHRGASYLTGNVTRVGAEPGVNPRRASANLLYGHIRQDCEIEVINYSTIRSSFDRMNNREFIDFLNDPVASERQPWMKVRWINIGGLSWDVLKAVSIKYDLHPLSLEDIFHNRSQTRSKADYYNKHLFLRVLCHQLGQEDEPSAVRPDSPAFETMLMDGPRSETPSAMSDPDTLNKEAVREEDDYTMYETMSREKKRSRFLPFFHTPPQDLEGTLAHRSGSISSLGKLMSRAAVKRRKQAKNDITLKALKQGDRVNVNVSPMFIFLLRDGTVISLQTIPNVKLTSPISTRLHQRDTGLRNSADPSLLVHALLDLIVDNALEVIDEYHAKIERFERAILLRPHMQTVRYLHILSGDLIMHKRTMEPIRTLIYGLRRYDLDRCQALIDMSDPANANVKVVGFMSHKTKIYLADVFDHTEYILSSLDMFAAIAENLIGYTFNLASYKMNQVMRRLTLATIIFLPLTLLTGYFGMNFTPFWGVDQHSDLFFWEIALPVMAVVIPLFLWSDIKEASRYLKKEMVTREAVKEGLNPDYLTMFQFLLVLCLSLHVFANTEIVNFHVSESRNEEFSFTNSWPRLNHTHSAHQWTVLPAPFGTPPQEVCHSYMFDYPCPHQLWLVLDLTHDWSTYSSFTLRASWPASYPVDFSLEIFNPESLPVQFEPRLGDGQNSLTTHTPLSLSHTRLRYARIRLVDIGVLTPSPISHAASTNPTSPTPVPFILALEPLYFGVLPSSVVPVLAYIFGASVMACMIVPPLIKYLDGIASHARKELLWDVNRKHD